MSKCVNLIERFGRRYRITFDPAYNPKGVARDKLDPWYMQIACRYGTIYPDGSDHLRIDIDGHNIIARRVAELSGCELVQNGDFEKTVRFSVNRFDTVARIVRPHRRPQMSAENSRKAASRLRNFRSHFPTSSPVLAHQTDETDSA